MQQPQEHALYLSSVLPITGSKISIEFLLYCVMLNIKITFEVIPVFLYLAMIDTPEARDKFEILYRKYRNLMYHVAYQIVRNREDAEDAVQQAFFSIIKIIDKIHGSDCPETKSLVVLITERKAIDILRTSHRDQLLPLNEEVLGLSIPLPGDNGLSDALAALPAQYREILLLRFDNGYTTRDLSSMLGISESGIRKLIGRARKALKKELEGGHGKTIDK